MKAIAIVGAVAMAFAFVGNGWAYEGGTKAVAVMTHPERARAEAGPLFVIPYNELSPGKAITRLLHRVPQPTLSIERIREEKMGPSTGTKTVVLFQKRESPTTNVGWVQTCPTRERIKEGCRVARCG